MITCQSKGNNVRETGKSGCVFIWQSTFNETVPGSPEIESPVWGQQVVVLLFYDDLLAPERMTKVALEYAVKTSVVLWRNAQPAKILGIDGDV